MFNCKDQNAETWSGRAEICADMLAHIQTLIGDSLDVADVGCGDMKLKRSLDRRGTPCRYDGFDLIPQSNEVKPFDLRRDRLPRSYDVATLLGVIEYIEPLDNALAALAEQSDYVVLSHVIKQDDSYPPAKCRELGWINHLTQDELESKLGRAGLLISESCLDPEGKTLLMLCRPQRCSKPFLERVQS